MKKIRHANRGSVELIGAMIIIGVMATGVGTMTMLSSGSTKVFQDQVNAQEGFYAGELAATHLFFREKAGLEPLGTADEDGGFEVPVTPGAFISEATKKKGKGKGPGKGKGKGKGSGKFGREIASVEETEEVAADSGNFVRRLEAGSFRVIPKGALPDPSTRCGEVSFKGRGTTHRVCLRTLSSRKLVAAGLTHGCAVVQGSAKCWGSNIWGELGNGNSVLKLLSSPTQVKNLTTGVEAVTAGMGHACAIQNGAAFCWGMSILGETGNPAAALFDNSTPLPVQGMSTGVTSISAGDNHTCAVMNGGAYCWGSNAMGQLGSPLLSPISTNVPIPVPGLESGVTEVAAGGMHTCAIQNGGVFCWGSNLIGEIGIGAITGYRAVPTAVPGLDSGVTTLSAGFMHTCASGTKTWCWGFGLLGQLGAGFSLLAPAPVEVAGGKRYTNLTAGILHTCATNGTDTDCWGTNFLYAFGDLLPLLSYVPVAAPGLAGAGRPESLAAGALLGNFTCSHDGRRVRCGGANYSGQLGLGLISIVSPPDYLDFGLLP